MAFTTDTTTDIGKVRLFISDLDSTKPVYPDDSMIQAFLDEELGDVKGAAALALECIAGSMAMTLKVMTLLDLKTDGRSVAESLLKVAQRLRDNDVDWCGFDIAQVVDNSMFSRREYLLKLIEEIS